MKKNMNIFFNILFTIIIGFFIFKISFLFGLILALSYIIFKISLNKHIIYIIRGSSEYKKSNYNKSLEFYKKAALSPNTRISIINTYCYLELQIGSPENANTVISLIKENSLINMHDLEVMSALIHLKMKHINEALYILESLYETDYRSTTFYEIFGYTLLTEGNFKKALEISIEGYKYDRSNTIIRANIGEIYYKLGDIPRCVPLFQKLIDEEVTFSEPYYYMGVLEKKTGNINRAKNLLKLALQCKESILSNLSKNTIEKAFSELN